MAVHPEWRGQEKWYFSLSISLSLSLSLFLTVDNVECQACATAVGKILSVLHKLFVIFTFLLPFFPFSPFIPFSFFRYHFKKNILTPLCLCSVVFSEFLLQFRPLFVCLFSQSDSLFGNVPYLTRNFRFSFVILMLCTQAKDILL